MVQTEVDVWEASENIKLKSAPQSGSRSQAQGSSNPTASALLLQSRHIRCVYCNAPQYSTSCDKFRDMKERKDIRILIKARRCLSCLKTNHKTRECLSAKEVCCLCQQKHHQSICSLLSKKIEPFVPNSFPSITSNPDDSTETSNHTSSDKNTMTVLLQTARAIAYNPETGSSTQVQILFDSGS